MSDLRNFGWMRTLLCGLFAAALSALQSVAGENPPEGFVPVTSHPDFRFMHGIEKIVGEPSPIEEPYYIGKFPVTCEEYARSLRSDETARAPRYWKGGTFPAGRGRHPVVGITKAAAERYCRWLGLINTNWTFRLPSEAEWEHAARGASRTIYPWGHTPGYLYNANTGREVGKMNFNAFAANEILREAQAEGSIHTNLTYVYIGSKHMGEVVATTNLLSVGSRGQVSGWCDAKDRSGFFYTDRYRELMSAGGCTMPVDAFAGDETPFGCRSMCGNCWEWTTGLISAVTGVPKGIRAYAVRGGAWDSAFDACTVAHRGEARQAAGAGFGNVGFRVVAVPRAPAPPPNDLTVTGSER